MPHLIIKNKPIKTNRFSASHETTRTLWNPKVQYHIYKSLPPILSWARPFRSMPPHFTAWRFILILSFHLHLGLLSGLFHKVSPPKP